MYILIILAGNCRPYTFRSIAGNSIILVRSRDWASSISPSYTTIHEGFFQTDPKYSKLTPPPIFLTNAHLFLNFHTWSGVSYVTHMSISCKHRNCTGKCHWEEFAMYILIILAGNCRPYTFRSIAGNSIILVRSRDWTSSISPSYTNIHEGFFQTDPKILQAHTTSHLLNECSSLSKLSYLIWSLPCYAHVHLLQTSKLYWQMSLRKHSQCISWSF